MFKRKLNYLIASGLGSGYSPFAPGTAGSLLAVALYCLFPLPSYIWLIITVLTLLTGSRVSEFVELEKGKDPSIVVIDEIAGQWAVFLFLPRSLWVIAGGFLFFRILDILKPYPAARLENIEGGWGIMLDDLAVAVYANILLHLAVWLIS
jgi:phosphatidylglycerophosphatase A